MRSLANLIVLAVASAPALAQAQIYSGLNDPALIAERHRLANERARIRADQRAAFAQTQQLQARLTLVELEAQRQAQANSATPTSYRPLRSPDEERALRQSATSRRQQQAASTSQIDAWLDRNPH